jgi:hypothetical protein
MIIVLFILLTIVGLYLILNKPAENYVPAPYISYDSILDGGIQKVEYVYEEGEPGPQGIPGEDAQDADFEMYFDSLFA